MKDKGFEQSPWLLTLSQFSFLHLIRHYFPSANGDFINRKWSDFVIGLSPPRGSLRAALLCCDGFITLDFRTGQKYHCRLMRLLQTIHHKLFQDQEGPLAPYCWSLWRKTERKIATVCSQVVLALLPMLLVHFGLSANVFIKSDMKFSRFKWERFIYPLTV